MVPPPPTPHKTSPSLHTSKSTAFLALSLGNKRGGIFLKKNKIKQTNQNRAKQIEKQRAK